MISRLSLPPPDRGHFGYERYTKPGKDTDYVKGDVFGRDTSITVEVRV